MKPYYDHGGITIYHGDCRELLADIKTIAAVITDPPYGAGYVSRKRMPNEARWSRSTLYEGQAIIGDEMEFDPRHLLILGSVHVFWGANYYADKLPRSGAWWVWDKKVDERFYGKTSFSDCEFAWTDTGSRALIFRHIWNGLVRQGEDSAKEGCPRLHPTQKPVELMQWCICRAGILGTILDPYVGSGTTLLAAKRHGNKAIGIEIEEKYCEIAAKRLSQEVFAF